MVDSLWRLGEMQKKTRGSVFSRTAGATKRIYNSLSEFLNSFRGGDGKIKLDGYQMIGDLVFVPTGTWANALRARTIVEKDFNDGILEREPKFILLQYGGGAMSLPTLQVCSYKKMDETENLPKLKGGEVTDLGKYMTSLLGNFKAHLGYYDPDTSIGQDEITVSGGHGGIGSISNIFGDCEVAPYVGCRFVDMFKNKIITDLSGVPFNLSTKWGEASEFKGKDHYSSLNPSYPEMDNKVISGEGITKVSPKGEIIPESRSIKRFGDLD
jgi:hypothetical protein